ncbi:bifunctional folylpolyglutamate synthase/dihydrofolate synthase [Robertmurraya sp. Marseille-Q9965]
MFHTYEEALNWIHARLRLGIKPGLKRMEWMMERLDHPEKKLKTVHIGGTNGKGSTVTFLRSILEESGLRVGTFTSPYFEHFNERISINGLPMNNEDLVELTNLIKPLSEELERTELGAPTEFEVITAMSFYYFAQIQPVDIVLYEVGLGGRFDSTNIIEPMLSIITSIGLDHTSILGETHAEIAFEKAGIIKRNTPILTAVKQPEAYRVIEEKAIELTAPIYKLGEQFSIENHVSIEKGERFTVRTPFQTIENIDIAMYGQHQTENAALAVMAVFLLKNVFAIEEAHLYRGLKKAYWPGRFEIVSNYPLIVLDGAHNEEGITTLVNELHRRYKDMKKRVIFAALGDKKLDKMIAKLDSIANSITFVSFDYPRAANAEQLFEISASTEKRIQSDWKQAISEEIQLLNKEEMLIITGSLYFLSEVKPYVESSL